MKKISVVLTVLIILFGAVCTPVKSSKTFWDPIIELNKSKNVDLKPPTISADNGIVDIAWSESSEGDSDIYLSSFRNESLRSKVEISQDYGQTLNTQNGNNESQWNANIITEDEQIHAVWLGNRDGDADIYYRYYNGAFWHSEVKINEDNFTEWQSNPQIAVNKGKVHIVWVNNEHEWQQLGDVDVHYRFYNGISWHPEEIIGTDTGKDPQEWPDIAVNDEGAHIVWTDRRDGDTDIYYTQQNGVSRQPETEISSDIDTESQLDPSIAVENNQVHIVWADRKDDDYDIYYKYFDGDSWKPEMEISQDKFKELQQRPKIAVDHGMVFITWEDFRDGDSDIYFRYYDGISWSTAEEVSSDISDEHQMHPKLAVDNKMIHLVWIQEYGFIFNIYYRSGRPATGLLRFFDPITLLPIIIISIAVLYYLQKRRNWLDPFYKYIRAWREKNAK